MTVAGSNRRNSVAVFAVTIFLSAFLLFQVQPLLSKSILPWFGGTPSVWTTCMLFFQTLLFAGYTYAHLLSRKLSPRGQLFVHAGLIVAAVCLLPIAPPDDWKPTGDENPALWIIALLAANVGLPFFILSSTGPLLQSWFSRVHQGVSPYRLYALSNVGSLLALISYPFLVEPAFDISMQSGLWSAGFAGFAVLCLWCAYSMSGVAAVSSSTQPEHALAAGEASAVPPTWGVRGLWFSLSMVASVLLLATTNQVCLDVAAVPFLWVMPLTLYLMTFILCFDSERWYTRKWFAIAAAVSIGGVCTIMMRGIGNVLIAEVLIYFAGLFFCTMVCHGELVKLKPDPKHLTTFYLVISAGGAAGGLFVGIIAPMIFPIYLEMHFALIGVWILGMMVFFRDRDWILYAGKPRWAWGLLLCGVFGLAYFLQSQVTGALGNVIEVSRNFYGVLRVNNSSYTVLHDGENVRLKFIQLLHGRIVHGKQFTDEKRRMEPTSYYGHASGIGLVLQNLRPSQKKHVGVIGLGAGTLSTYANTGDDFRFYEINPDVIRLAKKHFTFLSGCKGDVTIVLGDARQKLERESDQQFDVLAVDAFSGDAIPIHLLTRECFEVYHRHLKQDGILAIHISNLYFDLKPVVAAAADRQGWKAVLVDSNGEDFKGTSGSAWMILARDLEGPLMTAMRKAESDVLHESGNPVVTVNEYDGRRIEWTDNSNSPSAVLKKRTFGFD